MKSGGGVSEIERRACPSRSPSVIRRHLVLASFMPESAASPNVISWASLLAHWTQVAQASLALPRDAEGDRWRAAVPSIIVLQAVTHALAEVAGAGNLWIEKVVFDTREAESEAAAMGRDDAFGGLLRSIRALELDPDRLSRLADEFGDLSIKLPLELRTGPDALDPTQAVYLRVCLEDVKALLEQRLLREGRTA